ncbi:MAG: zinc-dependent alcohol dehydrogenase family protein [Parahaliea sp.]
MKAVQIQHVSDDLSGVEIIDMPVPEVAPGMLRVRMVKAALHPSDINYIRGEYREGIERLIWNYQETDPTFDPARTKLHPAMPCIPGGEGVGVVDACGEGTDENTWMGKRVSLIAGPPSGTWQEYVIAAPQQLSPLPDTVPDEQAALMMINPLTALIMVQHVLAVKEGQWVLLSAGASAVAKMVAALGRHYGFKTISLVREGKSVAADGHSLGDIVINTSKQDLRAEIKAITDGKGVDFALDCVGGDLAQEMVLSLTDGGQMLLYGTLSQPSMSFCSRDLMMANASVGGFYLPGWLAAQAPAKLGGLMKELGELGATGLFYSDIQEQYPISDAVAAVKASRQPGRTGKVLLYFK